MESPLFPIVFWCNAREASLIGTVSLFKFRHIEHLVVAAITALVVHRALPLMSRFENRVSPRGTEGSNPSPSSGESGANRNWPAGTSLSSAEAARRRPPQGDRGFESTSLQQRDERTPKLRRQMSRSWTL